MIILGIDPGLRKTGYGFLEKKGGNYNIIKLGTILLDTKKTTHFRLWQLFDTFSQLITEIKPDCMAIEKVFTSKKSCLKLRLFIRFKIATLFTFYIL